MAEKAYNNAAAPAPRNILQLVGSFNQGGSERQGLQLTKLLHQDGSHRIYLATLNGDGVLQHEAAKIGLDGFEEYRLSSFYDLNFVRQLKRCVAFLKANRIHIVQTHDFYSNVFGMIAARLARVDLKIAAKRETEAMRSPLQHRVELSVFGLADLLVANAEAVKEYLVADGVGEWKIRVIPNSVDLSTFRALPGDRESVCASFGLPTQETLRFVTLVANLGHRVKNQKMFLEVAEQVAEVEPETHFILAGEGELRKEYEALARDLGIQQKVHFLGRCRRVPELLSISSIGVLTSIAEGFSNSILEYMAAGLPVVATDVGGAREVVKENISGFLVNSGDSAAMSERIIHLLRHPAEASAMGNVGLSVVSNKFSCEAQLAASLQLYQSKRVDAA